MNTTRTAGSSASAQPILSPIEASIQIDPLFAYYQNRSPESIASELLLAGYRNVRYFVTDEQRVDGRLVHALREKGIAVWAMVLGNGVYTTGHLPPEWRSWQMTLIKPVNDGFYRLSPCSTRYTEWKKAAIASMLKAHPFTGIEIAEPYFPEWNGLSSGVYGDLGPAAQAAFKQYAGSDMPEFVHRTSPRYYRKDRGRYLLWMDFRVKAVNRFLGELINGAGGAREVRPDIAVATWSVAVDAGTDAVAKVREYQGIDAVEMIREVRPDLHVLQTHWPDWMRMLLPARYPERYRAFADGIRAAFPELPLGIQADIGSLRRMRRSRSWVERFAAAAAAERYRLWTAYEYSIGSYMYTERPQPIRALRTSRQRVELQFNKRVDPESAQNPAHYRAYVQDREVPAGLDWIQADGNLVTLYSPDLPPGPFDLAVENIRDTPSLWLLPNEQGSVSPAGFRIRVPGHS